MLSQKARDHLAQAMAGENSSDSAEIADAIDQALAGASGDIKSNGSVPFAADQSMGGHKLTNLADPTNPQDAATRAYVLANAGGGGGGGGTGGFIYIINRITTSIGTIQVNGSTGGTGGASHGTGTAGTAGTAGSAGIVLHFQTSTGTWL